MRDNFVKNWKEKHKEGIEKTPSFPCPKCKENTRGKFKCTRCGHAFTNDEDRRTSKTDLRKK